MFQLVLGPSLSLLWLPLAHLQSESTFNAKDRLWELLIVVQIRHEKREFWCTTHTLDRRLGTYSLLAANFDSYSTRSSSPCTNERLTYVHGKTSNDYTTSGKRGAKQRGCDLRYWMFAARCENEMDPGRSRDWRGRTREIEMLKRACGVQASKGKRDSQVSANKSGSGCKMNYGEYTPQVFVGGKP
ncbi:hypothetical protein B0H13DRAFT_1886512 [Mycena leptocephala]|nr:hypothetical protein B0H13DRAFT_1886512 [Mycena leptocephala]